MAFTYKDYEESERVKKLGTDLAAQEERRPEAWNGGTYGKSMEEALQKVLNRGKFQYDLNGDALYQQYKDRYIQQGKQAMQDTMGQASALTGGYGSSYAQQVGQQTYQGYLQGLNDKIPELYQLALDQYNQEGTDLLNQYGLLADQYDKDYSRYRDSVTDWTADRDYLAGRLDSERSFDYGKYGDARDFAYSGYRDQIADEQWQKQFDESVRQYNETMAENKRQFDAQQAAAAAARAASAYSGSSSGGSSGTRDTVTVSKTGRESASGAGITSFSNVKRTISGYLQTGERQQAEQLISDVWDQLSKYQKEEIQKMGFVIS